MQKQGVLSQTIIATSEGKILENFYVFLSEKRQPYLRRTCISLWLSPVSPIGVLLSKQGWRMVGTMQEQPIDVAFKMY